MTSLAWAVLMGAALLTAVPVAILAVQVVLAWKRPASVLPASPARPGRITVLVPAHNEASGIGHMVECTLRHMPAGARLVAVADNCTDRTAASAREAGAEVVERNDTTRRGKGFALDFGVRWLATDPPDILIVLDADCEIHADGIHRLAQHCLEHARPVQALYLMRGSAPSNLRMRIAEFAWLFKNQVRPLGFARVGGPCQLMGTGMAFPWALIANVSLANSHLVEDMKLGVDLALRGTPPRFAPDVLVTSSFPTSQEAIESQRQRWEHGHLSMLGRTLPRLIATGIARADLAALALAADLLVPPLALLVLVMVLVSALSLAAYLGFGWSTPWAVSGIGWAFLCAVVLAAWYRHGRSVLSLSDLLSVPAYILWKIPLYIRFALNRQIEWVRTKRDDE